MAANPVERSDLKPVVANETPSADALGLVVRMAGSGAGGGDASAANQVTQIAQGTTIIADLVAILAQLDVALSTRASEATLLTRTKPADQQHVIIDSSAALAVTGPLTDTQLRATPVPVDATGSVVSAVVSATDLDIRNLVFATDKVDVSGSSGVGVTGPLTDVQLRASPVPVSLTSTTITGTVAVTQSGVWDEVGINDSGNSITVDAPTATPVPIAVTSTADVLVKPGDSVNNALRVNVVAGGAGDGSILDGVTSSIKATVFDLTSSNPLASAIVDANGDQITSFGGGTQYTEGDVDTSVTGTALMFEDVNGAIAVASLTKALPVSQASIDRALQESMLAELQALRFSVMAIGERWSPYGVTRELR
jgi:hypothetical protein